MPGPPFRSKLEPFLDFITQERRKRATWKAIAQVIREKGTPCTPQGVQDYFKRRKRLRKLPLGFEPPVVSSAPDPGGSQSIIEQLKARTKKIQESKPAEENPEWNIGFKPKK